MNKCCNHFIAPEVSETDTQLLYWIHRIGETDPYTQGYIGITANLSVRMYSHKQSKTNAGKILLDGGYVSVLHERDTRDAICSLEYRYRPKPNIADNIAVGGYFDRGVRKWNPDRTWISCIDCGREFKSMKNGHLSFHHHIQRFHN